MARKNPRAQEVTSVASNPRDAADRLFGSAALVDLLIVLSRDSGRRYYVNELIRETGRYPRSVQLALARLEAAGVVRGERVANAKFYRLAGDHPFVNELMTIAAKIPRAADVLRQALRGASDVRVAFLRPEEVAPSELDVVVIGHGDRAGVEAAVTGIGTIGGRDVRVEYFTEDEWRRQAKRERSYVRWLLEEQHHYVIGDDNDLPS